MRIAFLFSLSSLALLAQIGVGLPGQYPGQYPGRYPPSGPSPGSSGPGSPGSQGRGQRRSTNDQKSTAPVSHNFSGVIRKLDEKSFDLELEDTRFLIIHFGDSTSKPADVRIGDGVDVVATGDRDAPFQASSIKPNPEIAKTINANDQIEPDEPVVERTAPPPTILARPGSQTDDDDGAPPRLKRGKPVQQASTRETYPDPPVSSQPITEPRVEPPPPVDSRQAFIEKARAVAASYLEGLPNYICQEVATRYGSTTRVPSWNVLDVVAADLVYEEGK
jgi:hypothetical protein